MELAPDLNGGPEKLWLAVCNCNTVTVTKIENCIEDESDVFQIQIQTEIQKQTQIRIQIQIQRNKRWKLQLYRLQVRMRVIYSNGFQYPIIDHLSPDTQTSQQSTLLFQYPDHCRADVQSKKLFLGPWANSTRRPGPNNLPGPVQCLAGYYQNIWSYIGWRL